MEDVDFKGRLVYLTLHLDKWLREINPKFNVPMANRLAKVIKVFDWKTPEGKFLKKEREKTGKWKTLSSDDFKFVLKVYHPELVLKNRHGITADEVLPRCYPGTKLTMFDVVPMWMLKDFKKEEKDAFTLENKGPRSKTRSAK